MPSKMLPAISCNLDRVKPAVKSWLYSPGLLRETSTKKIWQKKHLSCFMPINKRKQEQKRTARWSIWQTEVQIIWVWKYMADGKRNAKRWVRLIFPQSYEFQFICSWGAFSKITLSQFLQPITNQLRDMIYWQLQKQNELKNCSLRCTLQHTRN